MFSWLTKRQTEKEKPAPAPAAAPAPAPEPPPAADTPAPDSHSLNVDALLAPSAPAANVDDQPIVGPADPAQTDALKPPIVEAISTVFDPEIPVNIYELGLIYEIIVDAERRVGVRMTLTSPACPSAQQLPSEVRYKVKAVEGVADCHVDVVWEPAWTKDMMSEAAKLSLGIF
jgi:FeS assembly SUF system protein